MQPATVGAGEPGGQAAAELAADRDGRLIDRDYAHLPFDRRDGVRPGEVVEVSFALPAPPAPGEYRLEFDLVSEMVCWFEINGCRPASVDISIADAPTG